MANGVTQTGRNMPYPAQIQSGKVESSTLPSQKGYNRELLKLKAHWITDIFPDELVVQEKTISIIRNQFLVSFIETMPVRDIGRVVYIDTPFFAGIQIIGKNTAHQTTSFNTVAVTAGLIFPNAFFASNAAPIAINPMTAKKRPPPMVNVPTKEVITLADVV